MNPSKWFLIIFSLYIAGYLSHAFYLQKTVFGDGRFYYSWAKSTLIDGILPQQNKYTIGPAMAWTPAVFWTHALIRGTGVEFPYQFFTGLSSVLLAITGLVLLYRLLHIFYAETISLLATLSIAFATNLFFYGSLDPVNSHALSFFTATVFLSLVLAKKKNWFHIGLALAFVGLMRTQDLIYALSLRKIRLLPLVTGFLIGFFPQFLAWQVSYGKFWTSPYLSQNEGFQFFTPHILQVLFSYNNGLFFWTPILLLGLIGILLSKHDARFKCIVFIQIFLVSTWSTWWQGASYSGRMFVSVLPIFALGLGFLYDWLWKKSWRKEYFFYIFIMPLSLLNMLLIVYFLLIT